MELNEPYKLEILDSIVKRDPTAPITIYHIGEQEHPAHWWDLCAGPHVERTGALNKDAIELESVAGGLSGSYAAQQRCCRMSHNLLGGVVVCLLDVQQESEQEHPAHCWALCVS